MKRKLNRIGLFLVDLVLINSAYILALLIRFEGVVDTRFINYLSRYLDYAVYITILKLAIFSTYILAIPVAYLLILRCIRPYGAMQVFWNYIV